MKTLQASAFSRRLLLAAALGLPLAPALAAAPTDPGQPVQVERLSDFTYLVRVENPTQAPSKVQLVRTDNGALLYKGSSSDRSFGRKINVENLEDGQYSLIVTTGSTTHRYTLNLQTTLQRTTSLSTAAVPQP